MLPESRDGTTVPGKFADTAVGWDDCGGDPGDKILVKDAIADITLQQVLTRPDEFDVIATMNLNGDYLSDALAAQVGAADAVRDAFEQMSTLVLSMSGPQHRITAMNAACRAMLGRSGVIGVPLRSSKSVLDGLDALLSIVQMPPGVPVACVGVDNAKNAAVLAARILGS